MLSVHIFNPNFKLSKIVPKYEMYVLSTYMHKYGTCITPKWKKIYWADFSRCRIDVETIVGIEPSDAY